MPIERLDSFPPGTSFEADLVIVGGGKAGLTIAREFAGSTIKVLILESGLEAESAAHEELNRVEGGGDPEGEAAAQFRIAFHKANMATFDHAAQAYGIRSRMLGGCPYWGGKSATFDEIDFIKRDWVPYSGWPISREVLKPYFERAADALNMGPNIYGEELWALIGRKFKRPPLDKMKLVSVFWQFARSRLKTTEIMDIAAEFKALECNNIRVLTNATVVHIDIDPGRNRFESLVLRTLEGASYRAAGKLCVLSAGGIENARLLLISNRQQPEGLGNKHDLVGRFLMDHPGTRIGYFKKQDVEAARYLGFYAVRHHGSLIMYMHGLAFSPQLQADESLLNSAIYVLPEIAPDDPIDALKRLAGLKSSSYLADLWALAKSVRLLAKAIGLKLFYSPAFPKALQKAIVDLIIAINPNYVVREFQSKGVPHKLDRLGIHVITEQQPDPESRLVLSDRVDPLGIPYVKACWKISQADKRSVIRIGQLLQQELRNAGMPVPVMDSWIVENDPSRGTLVDMSHTIGTTRMSDDPRTGVVDPDCEVHGIKGLYVAGSSVFPTSGHANPTLMILALAIRLADRLKMDLRASSRG
jgi:choline dehydrogenase-like flavoprotein